MLRMHTLGMSLIAASAGRLLIAAAGHCYDPLATSREPDEILI